MFEIILLFFAFLIGVTCGIMLISMAAVIQEELELKRRVNDLDDLIE